MAYVYINESVDIEVGDFLDSCNSSEIEKIIRILKKEGYLYELVEKSISSESSLIEEEWINLTNKLLEVRLRIDNDDAEQIKNILKKY